MERDPFRFDLIPEGSTVLCAVSGGADSVYLLDRLYCWRMGRPFTLIAAHYNHNLRGEESRRDEEFVRRFVAERCGAARVVSGQGERTLPPVELIVGSGDVAGEAKRRKAGLEETARDMRYAFLNETADRVGADFIATAHNADDHAETLLLHLLRGCGLQGLTGIQPVRGRLIRPMLEVTRAQVEEYLRIYRIPHVEDSSNGLDEYLRNRLRHQVLPLLEELAPGFTERSRGTITRLRADEDELSRQGAALCEQALDIPGGIAVPARVFAAAPQALAVRAVRLLLARLNGRDAGCTAAHLEAAVELCRGTDPSARADLPGGITVRRQYELLVLTAQAEPEPPPPLPLALGENRWGDWTALCEQAVCPGKAYISPEEFHLRPGDYLIRSRQAGDRVRLGPRPERTVKRLMIDAKIPAHRREHIPVLALGERTAAVGGFGPDRECLAGPGEPALHIILKVKENGPCIRT